ncbi:MAG: phosphoribosylformylglycinamidine synthase subunit PurQ [Sumerlaeia bacterium]
MTAKIRAAVVVFPGSNCDQDMIHALRDVMGFDVQQIWHDDAVPNDVDFIAVPGGFSFGDYLRAGVLASLSPVMKSVIDHANNGTLVLGVCNGFQILLECGLLPGALQRNATMKFRCSQWPLRVERSDSAFTEASLLEGDVIHLHIAHGFGNYYLPAQDVAKHKSQVLFRYCNALGEVNDATNPNGSIENIAGITNEKGNVLGMMPHPERAVEALLGSTDGLRLFRALEHTIRLRAGATHS